MEPPAGTEKKPVNKWLVMTAVMLGTFVAPLDASIVNTVLPDITTYFHTSIPVAQWVPTVYLLTISCVLLLFGRLGDIFGYKKIFLFGVAGFALASALCGASQSIWMLIGSRVMQGLSASMLLSVGYGIILSVFPANEKGKAIGIYAVGTSVAASLGPTFGGLIAEYLNWHFVFFINVPIGIIAVLWGSLVIPKSRKIPGQRLDYTGAVTAAVFLLSLLLYANKGESWGWTSPLPLSLLGIAVLFGVLFFYAERKSDHPMLNLSLFNNRRFSFAVLSTFLCITSYYAIVFLLPFYLVFTLDYSIVKVGLIMASGPVGNIIMNPLSGTLSDRFGTRIFAVCGMCVVAFGMFSLSELKETNSAIDVIWRLVVTSLGVSMFQSPNNSAIMGSVPPQYLGITGGILSTVRNLGMVIGVAIAGAVLYTVAPVALSVNPDSFSEADMREFLSGFHWAFITGAGLACIAILTSVAAKDKQ